MFIIVVVVVVFALVKASVSLDFTRARKEQNPFQFLVVKEIVEMYKPSVMSIEEVFYGKNVKSALLLGHARAVPMVVSANYNMPLYEFSSRKN